MCYEEIHRSYHLLHLLSIVRSNGVYTYFVSAKLDEAVKANSAASPASVNADYENELAILREANQELSRQITELSMADNDKVAKM